MSIFDHKLHVTHDSVASKDNREPKLKTLLRNERQTEVISKPKVTRRRPQRMDVQTEFLESALKLQQRDEISRLYEH